MKDLFKNGILVLLIIGTLYIIYLRECDRKEDYPPEGQILISQTTWDSIKALADKPPIVKIDTLYLPGDTIKVPADPLPLPHPDPKDTTINHYEDQLLRKDINAWYSFDVRGTLINRSWRYVPIITEIRKDSIVFVPHIIDRPVPISKAGIYLYGVVGGNTSTFILGGGIDLINKKDHLYGVMYQKYGDQNFYSFKLGTRIRFK